MGVEGDEGIGLQRSQGFKDREQKAMTSHKAEGTPVVK